MQLKESSAGTQLSLSCVCANSMNLDKGLRPGGSAKCLAIPCGGQPGHPGIHTKGLEAGGILK